MMALAVGMTASAATLEERVAALEAKKDTVALREAMDKISAYGDARVRVGYGKRGRIGARDASETYGDFRVLLGMNANLDEQWQASVALATGAIPASGDVRMGNGFNGKGVGFARIYMQYTPIDEVTLFAGKMSQPWISASDLIWDSWVAPEGVAAKANVDLDDVTVLANVGAFQVEGAWSSTTSARTPIRLYTAQVAGQLALDDTTEVLAGASAFYWNQLRGQANGLGFNTATAGRNNGGAAAYPRDFRVFEVFAKLSGQCTEMDLDMPYTVFAQVVDNPSGNRYKYGYLVGATLGKATEGNFEFGYDYRYLGRDAVLSIFSESTVWGGGTDGKCHRISARYGVSSAAQVGLTAYLGKANVSQTQTGAGRNTGTVNALLFDVSASF